MALIDCPECRAKISSNAASCPHCGNPNPVVTPAVQVDKNSTSTTAVQLSVDTSAGAIAGIIALVGLVTIFFVPPIGLLMFMVAGALSMFGNKKVAGLQGACPHCAKIVTLPQHIQAADCPICKARFVNEQNRFAQA